MADDEIFYYDEAARARIRRAVIRNETETTSRDLTGSVTTQQPNSESINWQVGFNNANQKIPAYSCVAIGATDTTPGYYESALTQPSGASGAQYGLSGSVDRPYNGGGAYSPCAFHLEAGWATYNPSNAPTAGATVGPVSGQWYMDATGKGFTCVAIIDSSRSLMLVSPNAVGSQVAIVCATATTGVTIGLPATPYGSCCYAGVVRSILTTAPTMCNDTGGNRLNPSTLPVPPAQTCWIVVTDSNQGFGAVSPTLIKGDPMIGVLVGPYTVGSTTLPLYWVKKGQQIDTVQITGTAGATVTAGTGGVLPVTVQDFTAGATLTDFTSGSPMTAGVSAWLAFIDNPGGSFQSGATAIGGDNYQAQLCLASFTPSEGTNKRLYVCRKGTPKPNLVGKVYDTSIARGTQGYVEIWTGTPGSETDSGNKVYAWNYWYPAYQGNWVTLLPANGGYYIGSCQGKAKWVRGTIASGKTAGQSSFTVTTVSFWDGVTPGTTFTCADEDGIFPATSATTPCRCCYNPETDTYSLVWMKC